MTFIVSTIQTINVENVQVFLGQSTQLVGLFFQAISMIFTYAYFKRSKAVYYVAVNCAITCVINVAKIVYHSPRPYYLILQEIQVYNCDYQFGNPADIPFICSCLVSVILQDLFTSNPNLNPTNKILISFFGIGTVLTTCLVRVYNMASSFDQIFFALELGILLAMFLHNNVQSIIVKHIDTILEVDQYYQFIYNYIVMSTGLFLSGMGMLTLVYSYSDLTFFVPPVWISNIYYFCKVNEIERWSFSARCLIEGSLMAVGFGAYLGCVFQAKVIGQNITSTNLTWQGTFRLIMAFAIFVFCAIPYLSNPNISDLRIATLIYTLIPSFAYGFVVFGLLDILYKFTPFYYSQSFGNSNKNLSNQLLLQSRNQQQIELIVLEI
eukprot:403350223